MSKDPHFKDAGFDLPSETHEDARPYLKISPRAFEHVPTRFGDDLGPRRAVREGSPRITHTPPLTET